MDNLPWIFISALLVNNFVLTYFLGLCPFLGVSNSLETSFRLGLATTFVMLVTAVCAWVLNTYVLIHAPYLRLISFIVVIASTVQFIEMLIKKLSPAPRDFRDQPRLRLRGRDRVRARRRHRLHAGDGPACGPARGIRIVEYP
jgi:Na+-translocating ferredoxin:NAD+ oxidoreductase RnfA subunit